MIKISGPLDDYILAKLKIQQLTARPVLCIGKNLTEQLQQWKDQELKAEAELKKIIYPQ